MKRHVNIVLRIGGLEFVNLHSSLAAAAGQFDESGESHFHYVAAWNSGGDRRNGVSVELVLTPVDPLPEYPE